MAAQGPEAPDPGDLVTARQRVGEIGDQPAALQRRQMLPVAAQQVPGLQQIAEDIGELHVDGRLARAHTAHTAGLEREVEERQCVPAVVLAAELQAHDARQGREGFGVHFGVAEVAAAGGVEQGGQVEGAAGGSGEEVAGAGRTGPQSGRGRRAGRPLPRADQ